MHAADMIEGNSGAPQESGAALPRLPAVDDPPRSISPLAALAIWSLAALGAVLIHAGCVGLAYEYLRTDEDSPELGTSAIEIGVEVEAPLRDPANLPPGPDSDASTANPEVAEQKTEVEQTELPKAQPTETDDADRVVALQATKKPEDEQPKTPTVQTAPMEASVAAEATAMPSPENAKDGPRSTAPDLGTGDSLRVARATWEKELGVHLKKNLRYPDHRTTQSAEVMLRVAFDRTGHVVSAEVTKSSGDPAFDDAALAMMQRADPVPAPPPLVADQGLTYPVPVTFNEKNDKKRR